MASTESQKASVLNYMRRHPYGLTGMDMVTLFGALNYKNVIFELRESGVPIAGEWVIKYDTTGKEVKRWMRYYLPNDARGGEWEKKWPIS